MAIERRIVQFRFDELAEVVGEFDRISKNNDGKEWVTISPWVDPEHLPVVSLLHRMFSGRGSKVPEVTWVPAQEGEPAQLGVLHATGPHALDRLRERGVTPPATWRKIGDHSKRGLLFALHPETASIDAVRFALDAARALAEVPTGERWIAEVSSAR